MNKYGYIKRSSLAPASGMYAADLMSSVYTDGQLIAAINDYSGNGFHFNVPIIANGIIYKTNIINGKPVFAFTNGTIRTTSKVFANTVNSKFTAISLMRSVTGAAASNRCLLNCWYSAGAPQDGFSLRGSAAAFNTFEYFHAGKVPTLSLVAAGTEFNNNTWYILFLRRNGLNIELGYNLITQKVSAVISGYVPSTVQGTQLAGMRFSNATNGSLFKGELAELFLFDEILLNDSQITNYINYLKLKYNLTL